MDDDVLDAVGNSAVHGLFEVVDHFTVSVLHVVDDDLRSKASADVELRESSGDVLFDGADGESSGIVKAGSEGYDQDFRGADAVLIQRIVERSVAPAIASEA